MNKKAQTGIGGFLMVFITVIIGAVLFLQVSQDVGLTTTAVILGGANSNQTIATGDLPAVGSQIELIGQDLLSAAVVTNQTGGQVAAAGNYTVGENISTTTGLKTIVFQLDDPEFSGTNVTGLNITYTYGPDGYINDSGGRGMANLIPIFMALAIALAALVPTLRNRFDM